MCYLKSVLLAYMFLLAANNLIPHAGMCMCVKLFYSPVSSVVYVLGGFEDGSVVMWDYRNKSEELASLKLFSEPGRMTGNRAASADGFPSLLVLPVMCLAYDAAKSCGVCGSPLNTLESFSVSTSLVCPFLTSC